MLSELAILSVICGAEAEGRQGERGVALPLAAIFSNALAWSWTTREWGSAQGYANCVENGHID